MDEPNAFRSMPGQQGPTGQEEHERTAPQFSRSRLFYGVGISGEPDITASEQIIAEQCVATGRTQVEANSEVRWLNTCFGTYEVPSENKGAVDGRLAQTYSTDVS